MAGAFTELRKTLVRAIEMLDAAMPDAWPSATKSHFEPVVGQETPLDGIVYIPGYGTMSRKSLIKEIRKRIEEVSLATTPLCDKNHNAAYHTLYRSGVLKTMLETEIRHEGLEL